MRGAVPRRVIAVDWSGSASEAGQRRHIQAAVVDADGVRLVGGQTRDEVAAWLVKQAEDEPALAVGLDFAFSFPESYLRERGLGGADELWNLAKAEGEAWLQSCEPPFWGRPGKRKPAGGDGLRATDRGLCVAGVRPKSVFQIGGAGTVGTGSIRGMAVLSRLVEAGFSVWPFMKARLPVVMEIYPRLLTGPLVKSDESQRTAYLAGQRFEGLPKEVKAAAGASEDALDAVVSALAMWEDREQLGRLPGARNREERVEGRIWEPLVDAGLAIIGCEG